MQARLSVFLLSIFAATALLFSSCKGSSSVAGVTTPSNGSGGSVSGISGTVMGGLSPVKNANVQLFQAGNSTPLGAAVTTVNGTFSVPGNLSSGLYYLLVTNGNAGSGSNNQIQLMAIVGAGTNLSSANVTINELTTAAAGTVLLNFGLLNSTGSVSAPGSATGASNALAQYNNMVSNGALNTGNSNLSTNQQNSLNTLANALASCVQTSGSCSSLYNAATASSGGRAATSMMIALYNALTNTAQASAIYNVASPLAASTGIPIPGSAPTINNGLAIGTQSFSVGGNSVSLAIDSSGNVWAGTTTAIAEISPSGAILQTLSGLSISPISLAIDSAGNLWTRSNGTTVVQISPSGTILQSISASGPANFAIDANGNIWYLSSGNVVKMTSSGTTLFSTTVSGSNFDGLAFDASGNAWAANGNSSDPFLTTTVVEFNSAGAPLGTFVAGTSPTGLAFDPSGNLWVCNNVSPGSVGKLSPSGTFLGAFYSGSTHRPSNSAIDASGNVFAADGNLRTIVELNSAGTILQTLSIGTLAANRPAIDPSGNLWLTATSGTFIKISSFVAGPNFFPYSGPQWP